MIVWNNGLRVSLNNSQVILAFSLRAQITQCIKYSKLWLNKPYYCHFESHIWRLWIWFKYLWFSPKCLNLNSYVCIVFLSGNIVISWFVLTLKLSARLQNAKQCICNDWTSRQIYKHILALTEFSQSILLLLFRRRLSSLNCSFIVYHKRSLP